MTSEEDKSSVETGGEAEAKVNAPVKPATASTKSKSTGKNKSKASANAKSFGEIRINDTTVIRYSKEGSKGMNLPKPRETPKSVG